MSEAEKNELRRKNNESQKRRREKKRMAMLAENLISDSMTENPILFKEEASETDYEYRGVVPGGAGGAMVPAPDLGASVNPISAKGGRLCSQIFRPSDGSGLCPSLPFFDMPIL